MHGNGTAPIRNEFLQVVHDVKEQEEQQSQSQQPLHKLRYTKRQLKNNSFIRSTDYSPLVSLQSYVCRFLWILRTIVQCLQWLKIRWMSSSWMQWRYPWWAIRQSRARTSSAITERSNSVCICTRSTSISVKNAMLMSMLRWWTTEQIEWNHVGFQAQWISWMPSMLHACTATILGISCTRVSGRH